jgi:hypothetical protein
LLPFFSAGKEVGSEENANKLKYMLTSCHQDAKQNHNMKAANKSFNNAEKFMFGNDGNKWKLHSCKN